MVNIIVDFALGLAFVDGFWYVMWIAAGLAISSAAIAALLLGDPTANGDSQRE